MASKNLCFFALFVFLVTAQTSEYVEAQLASNFRVGWQFYDNEIVIKISVKTTQCDIKGWCGFGFGTDMYGTDVIVVGYDTEAFAWDRYAQTEDTPPFDTDLGGTDDITVSPKQLVNGTYTNGTTEVYVRRKLDTGDKYDFVITENKQTDYIWAYNPTTAFVQHSTYGTGSLNLASTQANLTLASTGSSSGYSDDFDYHGDVMSIVWMGFIPAAIMAARYFKWTWLWFWVHIALGIATIVVTVTSGSLTFDDNESDYATKVNKKLFHSRLGFSVISLVIGQGALGMLIRVISKTAITPYKMAVMRDVHFFTGWMLMIVAFIEIYYGWDMYDDTKLDIVYFFYAFIAALFAILELWRRFWYLVPCPLGCRRSKVVKNHQDVLKEVTENHKRYAFCDELILDVGRFADSHPGGKTFITETYGEDLGKYINGCSSYGKGCNPYYHTQGARLILERLSIGVVAYPDDMLRGHGIAPSYAQMTWRLVGKIDLGGTTRLLTYASDEFSVAKPKGIRWLGKHFRVTKPHTWQPVHRYYSIVYCMGMNTLQTWRTQIQVAGLETEVVTSTMEVLVDYAEPVANETRFINMVVKAYRPHGKVSRYMTDMTIGESVSLKGPLGPGLALTEESSGCHVGFAGGTGLVTFLDLVHLIWQHEMSIETTTLPQDFSLLLYVSFSTLDDTFALDLLRATQALCNRNRSRRFILHLFIVETTAQGKMTPEILASYINAADIAKAWACGPSPFNRWACEMLLEIGVDRSRIKVL